MEAQCRVIDDSVDAAGRGSFGAARLQLGTPAALEAEEVSPFPDTGHAPAPGSPASTCRRACLSAPLGSRRQAPDCTARASAGRSYCSRESVSAVPRARLERGCPPDGAPVLL